MHTHTHSGVITLTLCVFIQICNEVSAGNKYNSSALHDAKKPNNNTDTDNLKVRESHLNKIKDGWPKNTLKDFSVSMPALYRMVVEENNFYRFLKGKFLRNFGNESKTELGKYVYRYIHRYESEVFDGIKRWKNVSKEDLGILATLNHPFLIIQMLRRLVYEFSKIYPLLRQALHNIPVLDLAEWPTKQDLGHYASLVVVLQYFYDYNIFKFGRGTFGSVNTGVNISAVQSMELNYIATSHRCYSAALDFMTFSLDQATKYGGIDIKLVRKAFAETIKKHDDNHVSAWDDNYSMFTTKIGSLSNYTKNRQRFSTKRLSLAKQAFEHFKEKVHDENKDDLMMHNYMTLCGGVNWQEHLLTYEEKLLLRCWMKTSIQFGPIYLFKIELLSHNPYVIKIHDFVSEELSESLMEYSFKHLNGIRTKVLEPEISSSADIETEGSDYNARKNSRAASTCSVDRRKYPNKESLDNLDVKIEAVTDLNVREYYNGNKNKSEKKRRQNSEMLEIAANIPGGHFAPHFDTQSTDDSAAESLENEESLNYRLATFMIYLSKVDVGGRTVFPRIGLSIEPQPGSALFWYNYETNGKVSDMVYHGGCPVVLGQKWVATKWILGSGNFFNHKCSRHRS